MVWLIWCLTWRIIQCKFNRERDSENMLYSSYLVSYRRHNMRNFIPLNHLRCCFTCLFRVQKESDNTWPRMQHYIRTVLWNSDQSFWTYDIEWWHINLTQSRWQCLQDLLYQSLSSHLQYIVLVIISLVEYKGVVFAFKWLHIVFRC